MTGQECCCERRYKCMQGPSAAPPPPPPPPTSPHLPPPAAPSPAPQPFPSAPADGSAPHPSKPRRRWVRWTLGGVGALLIVGVVGTALSEPADEESQIVPSSEDVVAEPLESEVVPAQEPAPEPTASAEPAAPVTLQCSAWDPPIPYATNLESCDEAASSGRALAHQVGLADSPTSPAATIAFVSICNTLQGSEPKTYESPENYDLAVLLNTSGVCTGDLGMLVPAQGS